MQQTDSNHLRMPEALAVSFSNIMDSNSYSAGSGGDPLIADRERVLGPAYRLFYDRPVHLVRGQGSHLFDADGERYPTPTTTWPASGTAIRTWWRRCRGRWRR